MSGMMKELLDLASQVESRMQQMVFTMEIICLVIRVHGSSQMMMKKIWQK